jgi:isoquinoline 1-oxidoreductase subunit beta
MTTILSRREAMKVGAAFVLGFYLPGHGQEPISRNSEVFKPNAWVRITRDNKISVLTEIPELGQGTRTANVMMLADELEVEWSQIQWEQAPTIPAIYKHLATGGSGGTRATWLPMRQAGAQVREMLLTAAAQQWGVERNDCKAENGAVLHTPTQRRLLYGELAESASTIPAVKLDQVPLKGPKDFRFIGKPAGRVDTPGKVDGTAIFGIDVRVPGMLFAVIARCPHFGGKLISCDDSRRESGLRRSPHRFYARNGRQFERCGRHRGRGDLHLGCIAGPKCPQDRLGQGAWRARDHRRLTRATPGKGSRSGHRRFRRSRQCYPGSGRRGKEN